MADASSPLRPRLKWALVASLGLNLVFVGLFAAAIFRGPPPPPVPGLWHYARALPDPYRRDLGRALRDSRGDWSGPRDALRGQRLAMADALSREPFDPVRAAAVLAEETRLSGELAARGREILLAEIARMSPEARAAYAEALRAEPERRPGPRRR
ncbi:MAG TPA: periplasmic heavy metal sensor [Amaricoccus sp.]|nr:periplasmic heavy metal sensor [Amaricoccus sp.]